MQSDVAVQSAPGSSARQTLGALIPVTWFFIFQPYLSPLPTNNDLQPVSLILAGLALLFGIVVHGRLPKRFLFILLLALGIEVIHFGLFQKPAVLYLATYIFLAFAWRYGSYVTAGMIKGIMAFHLSGILWQTLDPGSFSALFESFLRELKHTNTSGRGATGFTPEPTFAGALSIVYAIVYYRFFSNTQRQSTNILFFLMYLLSVIFTSSSLGYLLSPLVLLTWFLQGQKPLTQYLRLASIALLVVALATVFFEVFQVKQRGLILAKRLIENPEAVLLDSSLQERTRSLYIGYQSMQARPLGFGHGNFASATEWAHENHDLKELFINSRDIKGSASGAGSVMAGTGLLGVMFYLFVFLLLRGRSKLADMGAWTVSLAMFTFSFSPAFPLIYTMLVMRQQHERICSR